MAHLDGEEKRKVDCTDARGAQMHNADSSDRTQLQRSQPAQRVEEETTSRSISRPGLLDAITRGQRPLAAPRRIGEMTADISRDTRVTPAAGSPASTQERLPPLPGRRKRPYGTILSFILAVVLPTALVAVYYLGIASDQFVTSFHFAVRDAKSAATGIAGAGIPGVFGGSTSANAEENYIVTDYIASRQAVEDLEHNIGLQWRYSRPGVDWIARFDPAQPFERFVRYWKRMVTASFDQVTGISIAEVRAFTSDDAYAIATELARLSEKLINEVANRPQLDAVRFAEQEVKRAEDRLKIARGEVTRFRNSERLIDPQASVVTSNVLLAQTLRQNLTSLETELSRLRDQRLDPGSPVVQTLQTRIKATREQLAAIESQVSTTRDGNTPLSKVVAEFEQLELERQFAQTMLTSAMQSLEEARSRAMAQHVYVSAYVRPAIPQSSTYPRRILSIAIAAFGLFLFWLVALLVTRSIREHLA